jgi:hypothetical protein
VAYPRSRGCGDARGCHRPEPGWGRPHTPWVPNPRLSRAGAKPAPRGCTVVGGLSGRAPTCPGGRAGPGAGAKHGPLQGVESAAEQATCVARESTPRMRGYGTVWLAKKMPADPHNHARVKARTDGAATRQFDLPAFLASAGPADGSASGASTTDALIV